jgi:hypothetical protein
MVRCLSETNSLSLDPTMVHWLSETNSLSLNERVPAADLESLALDTAVGDIAVSASVRASEL